jgi:hypothetical protein
MVDSLKTTLVGVDEKIDQAVKQAKKASYRKVPVSAMIY